MQCLWYVSLWTQLEVTVVRFSFSHVSTICVFWYINRFRLLINNSNMDQKSICSCSRPEVFCKKGVRRNFAKLTGKHLCQKLFFDKVASLKDSLVQLFSCEFCETSKNTVFYRTRPVAASTFKRWYKYQSAIAKSHLNYGQWKLQVFLSVIDYLEK